MDNYKTVKAIYSDDIELLLKKTNQYYSLLSGDEKCIYCSRQLDIDNIGIIIPNKIGGQLSFSFCCNNDECLAKYRNSHKKD